jgi:hypothetical protein
MNKDDAVKFLSEFIDRINKQDNRATASPYIICVQSLEMEFYSEEEMHADLVQEARNEDDEFYGYNHFNYVDKAWFFTEEGAAQHLELNSHNYRKPRTYVKHCWRSPEIKSLLEAVAALVEKPLVKH